MRTNNIVTMFIQAIMKPEALWSEQRKDIGSWIDLLKSTILPVVALVALVTAILTMVFGLYIPMVGVIRPSIGDLFLQMIGTVVIYTISIIILGWIVAYLAEMFGGKNDINKAILMLFLISIPTLTGQILGTLPFVGWILSLGLGIYALVLLYKAIHRFLEVPMKNRVKHFILFFIASFLFSVLISATFGKLFAPNSINEQIQERMPITKQIIQNGS